jgi:hypothetical protein
MAFDIRFSGEVIDGSEVGNAGHVGEIILGDEREMFVSLVGYWSPADYLHQWKAGIRRLVSENSPSCLVSSLHDPQEADVLSWWLLYPMGSDVHVQDAILLLSHDRTRFSTTNPYAAIPPWRQLTDEGKQISEWIVPLQDFVDYLHSTEHR